jgi:hypothetical protein
MEERIACVALTLFGLNSILLTIFTYIRRQQRNVINLPVEKGRKWETALDGESKRETGRRRRQKEKKTTFP